MTGTLLQKGEGFREQQASRCAQVTPVGEGPLSSLQAALSFHPWGISGEEWLRLEVLLGQVPQVVVVVTAGGLRAFWSQGDLLEACTSANTLEGDVWLLLLSAHWWVHLPRCSLEEVMRGFPERLELVLQPSPRVRFVGVWSCCEVLVDAVEAGLVAALFQHWALQPAGGERHVRLSQDVLLALVEGHPVG